MSCTFNIMEFRRIPKQARQILKAGTQAGGKSPAYCKDPILSSPPSSFPPPAPRLLHLPLTTLLLS